MYKSAMSQKTHSYTRQKNSKTHLEASALCKHKEDTRILKNYKCKSWSTCLPTHQSTEKNVASTSEVNGGQIYVELIFSYSSIFLPLTAHLVMPISSSLNKISNSYSITVHSLRNLTLKHFSEEKLDKGIYYVSVNKWKFIPRDSDK
jgi:hypothetical protein